MTSPLVTIAVPSFNQGRYLDAALQSIFDQDIVVEVFVVDGGSTDNSLEVIEKWKPHLAGWRSHPDEGQATAINEGIAQGTAPYVSWLNSDDWLLPGGLAALHRALETNGTAPAAYGRCFDFYEDKQSRRPVWVEPFEVRRLALRCIICQPGTLIRRTAWAAVGGVDANLHMAMDYDLWWKLYGSWGPLQFVDDFVAVNRIHVDTKTSKRRSDHYREAMRVVRRHYGSLPAKWWLAQPYKVWWQAGMNFVARHRA